MRMVPLDSDLTRQSYYDQTGNGSIPIYSGEKYQAGYGLGSIFGSILKAALPVVKQGVKSLGKTALQTGVNIAKDKLSGKSFQDSLSDNFGMAKREVLSNGMNFIMNKTGNKKRKRQPTRNTSSRAPKRRRRRATERDIFTN